MPLDMKHAAWISHRVRAALSHYPADWSEDEGIKETVLDDWVDQLSGCSKMEIETAISAHIGSSNSKPTPNGIRARIANQSGGGKTASGDRSQLSIDEIYTLENKVIPGARAWMQKYPPGHNLYEHATQTLDYWGVEI